MNTTRTATLLTVFFGILAVWTVSLIAQTLDKTRTELSDRNTGAFNSLTQLDRNFDQLMNALVAYQRPPADNLSVELKNDRVTEYQDNFEILWASAMVLNLRVPGTANAMPAATRLLDETTIFLDENDQLINRDTSLSLLESQKIYQQTKSLADKYHDLGHNYFLQLSRFSDELKQQTRNLYRAFLAFAVMLVCCGTVSLISLSRSNKRSIELFNKAKTTEEKLTQVVDELRSGKLENKAKDSFLAAASHDLRQPLHALGLFLRALETHVKPTGQEIMHKAQQSSSALNKLLSSLLDLSRLDAGTVKVSRRSFSVAPLFQTLQQEFQPTASDVNITLDFNYPDVNVYTDRMLFDRILRNLIANALTHSRGTSVQVLCIEIENENKLSVTVADNGIGIPNNSQDDIFSEYFQIGNPERDRSKGLGIGLAIVKRLCGLLHLELKLDSEYQQGCKFTFAIPQSERVVESPSPKRQHLKNQNNARDMIVALIEDEREVRESTEILLDSLGYKFVSADSAADLITKLSPMNRDPDILITDYRLRHGQTGDQAINTVIRAIGKEIPSAIITGDTSPQRVKEMTDSGYILVHKPFEAQELISLINNMADKPNNKANAHWWNSETLHPNSRANT